MNWRGLFFKDKRQEILMSGDNTMEHHSWQRETVRGTVMEDVFVNSDPQAPVAAVIIFREQDKHDGSPIYGFELMPRTSDSIMLIRQTLKKLYLGEEGLGAFAPETYEGLNALGMNPGLLVNRVITEFSRDGTRASEKIADKFKKAFDALGTTDLISTNTPIRKEMQEAISAKLHVMRTVKTSACETDTTRLGSR